MKKRLSALLLAAAVAPPGVCGCARSPAVARHVDDPLSIEATQALADSTTVRVRGTIGRYDASTRVLSLATSNGMVQLQVSSAARIRRDGHPIVASDLNNLHGYPAAVRYSESGGTGSVTSVHILEKPKE